MSNDADQEAKQAGNKKINFRFCRECSNLLYPKEDEYNDKLMFACRNCHWSENSISDCVYRNALQEQIAETAGNIEDVAQDPTLPHAAELCSNCGATDAVYFQSQQRTAETGMALFYVCCRCSNVWSTLDNKN